MPLPSQQTVFAAAERAPDYVKDIIQDAATTDILLAIGRAHQLHIDAIGTLARANTAMLLGLVSPSEFVSYIAQAGVAPDIAAQIATEVNEKIFKPLRTRMQSGAGPAPTAAKRPAVPPDASRDDTVEMPRTHGVMPPSNMPGASFETPIPATAPVGEAMEPPMLRSADVPRAQPPSGPTVGAFRAAQDSRGNAAASPPPAAPMPPPTPPKEPRVKAYGVDPYREPIDETS
ncbi:hypothetical protein KGQ55_03095 [Patescibacteria group bacterium]|nr:hypothetical protein [Patescibacteria group bacterium]